MSEPRIPEYDHDVQCAFFEGLACDCEEVWDTVPDFDPRSAKQQKARQGMQVSNRSMKRVQGDLAQKRRSHK